MTTKICHKCNRTLPTTEFWKDRASRDGFFNVCRTCGKEVNRRAFHGNRDKELARNQKWRDSNKPRIRDRKSKTRAARIQWLVYRLDFDDGCFYIGSTNDLYNRLSLHRWEMRQGIHRNSRIRRHGYRPESFTAKVLARVTTKDEARRVEGQTIDIHFSEPACLNLQRVSYIIP